MKVSSWHTRELLRIENEQKNDPQIFMEVKDKTEKKSDGTPY